MRTPAFMNRITAARAPVLAMAAALSLFATWTIATWFLEGRIETLLRADAVADRARYAIIANLLIGVVVAIVTLRYLLDRGWLTKEAAGFASFTPSALRLAIALALGLALYGLQGAPSLDPVVLTNAFCQVLVVSIAEVVVCWVVMGATVDALLKPLGSAVSVIGAAMVASVLFGAYHFAHSAPFNSPGMVTLLTLVGLATSAFFFISRDVYATILFHNFLALIGVVQALAASGQLNALDVVQPPLLLMALATIVLLALSDRILLRRRTRANS